jgi:hypothetical protein
MSLFLHAYLFKQLKRGLKSAFWHSVMSLFLHAYLFKQLQKWLKSAFWHFVMSHVTVLHAYVFNQLQNGLKVHFDILWCPWSCMPICLNNCKNGLLQNVLGISGTKKKKREPYFLWRVKGHFRSCTFSFFSFKSNVYHLFLFIKSWTPFPLRGVAVWLKS